MITMTPHEAARNATVEANLALVYSYLGARYRGRRRWVDWDDVVQEGALGLMHAVDLHEPERGTLSTYSRYWIKVSAAEEIIKEEHPFHVPRWARESEAGTTVSNAWLDGIPAREEEEGDGGHAALLARLWAGVDRLREPDRTVIRLRYGECLLQREIGERLGRSTGWANQTERRAIDSLRHMLVGREEDAA
jgi:RNA polymerase sigma factor (sigma-70 family)